MKKHVLSLLFLGLFFQLAFGQPTNTNVGDVVMAPPNAAGLGKYIDLPVSYFTGLPNNSLSIYTVSDGKVSLPISLNYHSSGIKVAEMASWVGTGWNLSAGGTITRTILGKADDAPLGYYQNGQFLDNGDNGIESITGNRDGEPDLFSYSLPNGISGRFYFTGDGSGMVEFVPKQDLKIVEETSNGVTLVGFTIIDKTGTKYIFGKDGNRTAQERTINQGDVERISSWYLLRIQSFDEVDNITLDYQTENYNYKTPSSCKIYYLGCDGVGPSGTYDSWSAGQDCVGNTYSGENHYYTTTQVPGGMRLSTITTPTETVSFAANTVREDLDGTSYRLDSVSIASGSKFCKRFRFDYDYFKDTAFPASQRSESKRLRLLSVQEVSCAGTYIEIPPYTFEYYGILNGDGSPYLPQRLDKASDEWGFFNGQAANNNYSINLPENTRLTLPNGRVLTEGQAKRDPSFDHTKYGVLKKLNNPMGGSVEFEYELNDYYGLIQSEEVEIVPEIKSCPNPIEAQCCGEHDRTTVTPYTFTSQGELDRAYFTAVLTKIVDDAGNGTIDCNSPLPTLVIRALEVTDPNNPIQRGYYSYNLNSSQQFEIREDIPLNQLGALSLNVPYVFEVSSDNGQARFVLSTVSDESYDTRSAGGLRIRKITAKDGQGLNPDIVKTYEYKSETNPTESSGILFQIPKYAYFVNGDNITPNGQVLGNVEAAYFMDNSIVPLGGYDGISLGYKSVKEILGDSESDNGYNVFTFFGSFDPLFNFTNAFPRPPAQLNVYKGKSERTSTFKVENSSSIKVTESEITANVTTSTYSPNLIYKTAPPIACGNNNWYFYVNYRNISSNRFQQSVVTSFKDGVSTQMVYDYDDLNRHLAPIGMSMTNSDGLKFITEYKYPFDRTEEVYDSMVARNQIATPIETINKVDDNGTITQTGGKRINCDFFDIFGQRGGSGLAPIYPYLFEDYEMTWDANGMEQVTGPNSGWDTIEYVGAYNMTVGKPLNSTGKGWETEFYTWNTVNKKITVRTYEDFQWVTNYFTGTGIPSETIDIDAQDTDYDFDPLMRLTQINERDGNVVTDISYGYKGGINTHNFINQKVTYQPDGFSLSELRELETRQYMGGLGRLLQSVQIKHSPDGANPKDVISAVSYDNQSRVIMAYEPFASTMNDGSFQAVPNGTDFTQTEYEVSPLNRAVSLTPPDWYSTHTLYGKNETAISISGTSITYAIGELNTITTIEPDGSGTQTGDRSIILADKRGKPVLVKRQDQSGSNQTNTYTLFDQKERATTIIPPAASLTDAGLIYTYLYSGENNLLEKKVPDAAKIETRYNARNLPIAFQDGNLRSDGKWMVTEYDVYGRPVITGLNTTPTNVDEVWTASFWDGAQPNNLVGNPNQFPDDYTVNSFSSTINTGKLTGTATRVLEGNQSTAQIIERFMFYDQYGRLELESGDNHLPNGALIKYFDYDFADNLTRQRRRFHLSPFAPQRDTIKTTFDHQGRVRSNFHSLHNEQGQQISQLEYTIKDELKIKFLGKAGNGFLQQVDYTYLPNRFLKGINSIMTTDDLFQLNINYDQEVAGLSGTGQKNGNITSLQWQVKGGQSQTYGYAYDFLNRLTSANYDSPDNDYKTTYSYDARGNMSSITRRGMYNDGMNFKSQQIDNMAFTPHAGTNKVKTITDAAPCPDNKVIHQALDNTEMHAVEMTITADNPVNDNANITYQAGTSVTLKPGFHAKAGTDFVAKIDNCPQGGYETDGFVQRSANDYLYDSNGNQTRDPNNGTTTDFNYLNLPHKVTFDNGNVIEWLYLANGTKVQKAVKRDGAVNPILKQDYISGIEYKNDTIDAVYITDGRLAFEKGNFKEYQYYIRDYLGNNRVLFSDVNGTAQILQENHFYPYGQALKGNWSEQNNTKNQYLYGGKELSDDFGIRLYDHGGRWRDPLKGNGWISVDPLADDGNQIAYTPFHYGYNNPISFNDPSGLAPDNEFEVRTNADGTTTTTQTGTEGNDEKDYVTYVDANGNTTGTETIEVEVEFTDGPGAPPSPGKRLKHGKDFTIVWALDRLFSGGNGSKTVKEVAGFARKKKTIKNPIDKVLEFIDRKLLNKPKKRGDAPTFKKDGTPVEIHHIDQNPSGPFKEMHWKDHRGKGNHSKNHPNRTSRIDRKDFKRAQKSYWGQIWDKIWKE